MRSHEGLQRPALHNSGYAAGIIIRLNTYLTTSNNQYAWKQVASGLEDGLGAHVPHSTGTIRLRLRRKVGYARCSPAWCFSSMASLLLSLHVPIFGCSVFFRNSLTFQALKEMNRFSVHPRSCASLFKVETLMAAISPANHYVSLSFGIVTAGYDTVTTVVHGCIEAWE
jgi:hypothetical protein